MAWELPGIPSARYVFYRIKSTLAKQPITSMLKIEKYHDILFATLSEITSLIIGGKDKRMIFQRVLDTCLVTLEAQRVYLLELAGDKIIKYSKSKSARTDEPVRIEELPGTPVLRDWMIKESQEGHSFAKGEELAFDLPFFAHSYLEDGDPNRVIVLSPLVAKKSIFGLLVAIRGEDGGSFTTEDEQLTAILANQAAIALENRLLYQQLEREAITDGLTGVYNYRYLINSLDTETRRARRFAQTFSFVMLDVDNLKQYNDRLGHLGGSEALRQIAQIISRSSREIDLVSKYGGDEFGIILPQTDLSGAVVVTRRIVDAVAGHLFDGETKGLLTCSAGLSSFPRDGATGRELIASADKALYQAKRAGKNTVVTTEELG